MPTTLQEAFAAYEASLENTRGMNKHTFAAAAAVALHHLKTDVSRITGCRVSLAA